eukprot:774223-Lingulodinium_polyedra.AAC.1
MEYVAVVVVLAVWVNRAQCATLADRPSRRVARALHSPAQYMRWPVHGCPRATRPRARGLEGITTTTVTKISAAGATPFTPEATLAARPDMSPAAGDMSGLAASGSE